jgi:hypothetical protein
MQLMDSQNLDRGSNSSSKYLKFQQVLVSQKQKPGVYRKQGCKALHPHDIARNSC